MEWLKRILVPPVFPEDEEKSRRARILNVILWLNLVTWVLALVSLPFSDVPLVGSIVLGALLGFGVFALWMLHRGYVKQTVRLISVALWLMTIAMVIITGGINNPEVAGFITVILVAGLLGDARSAIVITVMSVLAIVGIQGVEASGLLPAPLLPATPVSAITISLVNILLSSGLVYVALNDLSQAFLRIRKNEASVVESNENLQALMTSMEYLVEERTHSAEAARADMEMANQQLQAQIWQTAAQAGLNERMSGDQDIPILASNVVRELCQAVDAQVGALFLLQEGTYRLAGSYAFTHRKSFSSQFLPGEGLAGQAAFEKKLLVLHEVPPDYMALHSGMLELAPQQIVAVPFLFDGEVLGVVELAGLQEFSSTQLEFLERALESVGVAFGTAQARTRVNTLLAQTQQQALQLQQREETLRTVNEELQAQAENLQVSQNKLRQQQANLEAANVELEEKTDALQQQRSRLDQQNRELLSVQEELKRRAEELQVANKYKSEFLANMSHELRTPLNSLLILARMLANNEQGNLTDEQVKSTQVIYNSGSDLLKLINDILDLSKVEAGRMEFYFELMPLTDLVEALRVQFEPIASDKGVPFMISRDPNLPEVIETDPQRVRQVIKNLLSNAFKFTEKGSVTLYLTRPQAGARLQSMRLEPASSVAIQVTDTGIGISSEQQAIVFEAFQQADGSTSRRYGGTGLGLAIAREMAQRLGGYIELQSVPGQGSTFSLVLPERQPKSLPDSVQVASKPTASESMPVEKTPQYASLAIWEGSDQEMQSMLVRTIPDDRESLRPGDRVLLVVEDDANFAGIVLDFAHKKGFKCLLAGNGESGLDLASRYQPQAIILDLQLPGMSGWEVLDALKRNQALRHIPVHIMSVEDETMQAFQRGVLGFVTKPVSPESLNGAFLEIESFISRQIKSLLLVEDDEDSRRGMSQLLAGSDVEIIEAASGRAALELLRTRPFDCMILDLNLPDMTGFSLLEALHEDDRASKCPIIVYTGRALSEAENHQLMQYADSVIVKGVKSPERLLDETALFLHRVVANLPEDKQQAIQKLYRQEDLLRGKKILVVDDDMRNSFALSRLLSERGMQVEIAANGQKALDLLADKPHFDLVLMDVMMPVLDGLETTRRIRQQPQFRNLPVLALTAKAMKGDREKCLEAGANDYLSKPVDADRLFSMLRVWLYHR